MLPDILADIPLRVSFLPMSGCAHFCSFCADNAGRRMRPYPFGMIDASVRSMNIRPESVALYNSCDGLAYLWKQGSELYTVNHLERLFRLAGAKEILLSSPGIEDTPVNRGILDGVGDTGVVGTMLSLNREHLLDRNRLEAFLFTARRLSKKMRCQVRIVYTSPEERSRLMRIADTELSQGRRASYRSPGGFSVEAVPAAPLGRGRNIYFGDGTGDARDIKEHIIGMYRVEPFLKEYRFMTAGGYESFLRHAAVQFAGYYIILLTPTPAGMDIALKVTDLDKTLRTRGLSHAAFYRFDEKAGRFTGRGPGGAIHVLDLLLFDLVKCDARAFSRYLDRKASGLNRNLASRVFAAFMASDLMREKNVINDRMRMMIMNPGHLEFYRETLDTIVRMNHPALARDCADAGISVGDIFAEITGFLADIGWKI
ncbi:MAG: hypothetical protein KBA61_08680 [Spirochaetes bacterium]|nr:hypothetical protein [Spirochaetota bacterium]